MLLRILSLVGALLTVPAFAGAQQDVGGTSLGAASPDEGHVAVMAGVSELALSTVRKTAIYAIRADMPIYPNLLVEGSFSYARYGQQVGTSDLFIPEAQVQLQGTWERWSPYVGLGGGLAVDAPAGARAEASFAPSFSMGARIALTPGSGVRVEGRLHGIDADFTGTVAQLTAGLSVSW